MGCLGLETSCAVLQFCVTFSPRHACFKNYVNWITAKLNTKQGDFVQSQTCLRLTELLYLHILYYPRYIPLSGPPVETSPLCPPIMAKFLASTPSPSLYPLPSVSFPVQRLNGSLTPFHTEHDRSWSYQNIGCNIPFTQRWNEKQIVRWTVRSSQSGECESLRWWAPSVLMWNVDTSFSYNDYVNLWTKARLTQIRQGQ